MGEAVNTVAVVAGSCDDGSLGLVMRVGEARERMLSVVQGALHEGHRPSEDGPCSHYDNS